ncbi:hypothetical protein EIP86_004838 [Pleurotus ostreatoroseus]|nr:hypothetical protein EIP86_004838 [Pleurotus ostreatoroseus]
MVLLRPYSRGRRVPPRVVRIHSYSYSALPTQILVLSGSTSPLRSSPRHTRRRRVPPALLVSAPEARVRTARPAPTARSTGRRRVRLASSGHSSPVSAVVLPGSRCCRYRERRIRWWSSRAGDGVGAQVWEQWAGQRGGP